MIGTERRAQRIERVIKFVPRDKTRSPVVGKFVNGLARQAQGIFDSGEQVGRCEWVANPLPAGIGNGDQMSGKIAAIHGRNVSRIQRTQISRIIPIVEMSAKALKAA